jgi:dihydrofolate reductase
MRDAILFIAASLDGYIAGPGGSIDWLFHDQDYGYGDFYASVDTVVMGRVTYDVSRGFEADPFPGKRVIVFSRQPRAGTGRAEFTSLDPVTVVGALRQEQGGAIWIVGGSQIVVPLMRERLIDTYRIFVHPIVLGGGTPLFPAGVREAGLRCLGVQRFESGLAELTYATVR